MLKNLTTTVSCFLFSFFADGVSSPGYASGSPSVSTDEALNTAPVVKTLQKLMQYEIDHSYLLSQCIDNLKNQNSKNNIVKMKEECDVNIKDLSSFINKYNGEIPAYEKDFKGFFMEGYAAMRGILTDHGALKALHTNQKIILNAFESAINSNLPEDILGKIKEIIERKKVNLKLIESQID